ncbi:BC1872 family protein [Peribacillus loiseleuriae]|uniref:BC1872 family protein n=1 Tax=Peribacillus loiseleuriae TaxID=1679170 RepID=UPI0006713084|nr:hypothetical protein [Peribacillus loiseleuriae]
MGYEIDRLIAEKVMGWTSDGYLYHDMITGDMCSINEFRPSEDLEDAWLIVEKISYGNTELIFDLELRYKGFWAYFTDGKSDDYSSEQEKTAPLAICVAALKATGVNIEEEVI